MKMLQHTAVLTAVMMLLLNATPAPAASFSVAGVRIKKTVKPMREIKREGVVSQSLDFSCGAAGLSTLLNYYLNEPISEVEIINALLQNVELQKVKERRGFSLLDLKNFAKTRGYTVVGYKMDVDFLRDLDKPVLVPIKFRNYRHFVIVRGVVADRVFLADPAAGNISMKVNKFAKIWLDGIGLVVENEHAPKNHQYALAVGDKDMVVADYKIMRRLTESAMLRVSVFPGEF